MSELDPNLYTVAWIAPLEIEARAALHMLDNKHKGRFTLVRGDDYVFLAGDMCGHNIVITTLPAGQEYGTGSAAALASQVKKFFPNLWFGLLVGVAAGLPNLARQPPRDIRLGDILVALPEGDIAGLVAYDLGKETGAGGSNRCGQDMCWPRRRPSYDLRSAASSSMHQMTPSFSLIMDTFAALALATDPPNDSQLRRTWMAAGRISPGPSAGRR